MRATKCSTSRSCARSGSIATWRSRTNTSTSMTQAWRGTTTSTKPSSSARPRPAAASALQPSARRCCGRRSTPSPMPECCWRGLADRRSLAMAMPGRTSRRCAMGPRSMASRHCCCQSVRREQLGSAGRRPFLRRSLSGSARRSSSIRTSHQRWRMPRPRSRSHSSSWCGCTCASGGRSRADSRSAPPAPSW